MTFKFEILILGQQMKMDISDYLFIYFTIMNEFDQLFIYLIQHTYEIHPYEIIRLWKRSSM
jgi:hypothetical protein